MLSRCLVAIQNKKAEVDFKAKGITRDQEGHFIVITVSVNQKDIIIINLYASNNKASKYTKYLQK